MNDTREVVDSGGAPHRPVILVVDDDHEVLGRVEHELRRRYGAH